MTPLGSGTHTLWHLRAGHGVPYIHSFKLTAPWHSWWAAGQSLPLIQVPSMSWHRHRDLKILRGLLSPMVWSDRPLENGDAWFDFPRLPLAQAKVLLIGQGYGGRRGSEGIRVCSEAPVSALGGRSVNICTLPAGIQCLGVLPWLVICLGAFSLPPANSEPSWVWLMCLSFFGQLKIPFVLKPQNRNCVILVILHMSWMH